MTVTTTISSKNFDTNGATTVFPFNFKFFKNADIVAIWIDPDGVVTPLTLDSDYTVSGAGAPAGGSITTIGPPLGAGKLTVARRLTPQQLTDLRNQGAYFAEIHEDAFDLMTMLIQQALDGNDRAITFPITDPDGLNQDLPPVAARANKVAAFDAFGQPIVSNLDLRALEQQPTLALASAQAAEAAANTAVAAANDAVDSKNAAQASELKAYKWADEAEDVPVELGKFSAKHWAAKAMAALAGLVARVTALENLFRPFTKEFVSTEQTITIGGPLSLAHGLGAIPKDFTYRLVCKVADAGWAVNDEVKISVGIDVTGTTSHGAGGSVDATNVYVRYAATSIVAHNKSTGASANLTPASWRLVVRAWA